ncbi:hypothetical protein [Pedobacter alpinus]|uniref:Uncharacterized protein n=1 Tax=Pedobacter alpinus TaxID=1590643 RepID=A0ABW5TNX7_9SPHI
MKKLSILPVIILVTLSITSCEKSKDIKISGDNLTMCEDNSTCNYSYLENADIDSNMALKAGSYRLFIAESDYSSVVAQRTLYFKAPMEGNSFQINENAIKAGAVVYKFVCPTCNWIDYKPIAGYVKGINTTPDKPAAEAKWLIEASVILKADLTDSEIRDTLYVKQYFVKASPEF